MMRLVVTDIVVIVALSVAIGIVAPRIPDRLLVNDVFPLTFMRAESPLGYRRLRVNVLTRALPELGSIFGGSSKSSLPGTTSADLIAYAIDVRRAEWVHWSSIAVSFVLFLFNPWELALLFVLLVAAGNAPFILVLRNNRLRIRGILEQQEGRQ
jgi:hypothetical protein